MERVHEVNRLKGMSVALESFVERWAQSREKDIALLEGIQELDQLLREAKLGAYDSSALDQWSEKHANLATRPDIAPAFRKRISRMLLELQEVADAQLDEKLERFTESAQSTDTVNRIKNRLQSRVGGAVSTPESQETPTERQKLILRKPAETAKDTKTQNIPVKTTRTSADSALSRFYETMWTEMEFLDERIDTKEHVLTVLDDILKCAETKISPMYLHLAGSLIYFLRAEGYKMAPYVKRLHEIEQIRATQPGGIKK